MYGVPLVFVIGLIGGILCVTIATARLGRDHPPGKVIKFTLFKVKKNKEQWPIWAYRLHLTGIFLIIAGLSCYAVYSAFVILTSGSGGY